MRKDMDELGAFFGVSRQRMSVYVVKWIRRLGAFAKACLVQAPRDWQSVADLAPEALIACGLQRVVVIGDCTDILVEEPSAGIMQRNQLRSDKSSHDVAMGIAWVTPIGEIVICSDLITGRSSELEACKACLVELNKIPAKFALMYDKGVNKLRPLLDNLNQVIVACYLRGIKRFSYDQGVRNRAIACNRYVVEIPFMHVKAWKFLAGIVPREDFYLLNDVWWWAVGFHNLKHSVLRVPHGP